MKSFIVQASQEGGLEFSSDYHKAMFKEWLKENAGKRIRIEVDLYESRNQRGFFEGGIIPIITYLHGGNYKDWRINKMYRELITIEFNGAYVPFGKRTARVALSTKGILGKGFIERVIDWAEENFGIDRAVCFDPNDYKRWRDELRPFEDVPQNYVNYLLSLHKLPMVKLEGENSPVQDL